MTERNQRGGPRRFYARPGGRSFEAYKAFLEFMAESLGIAPDVREDELRRGWQFFPHNHLARLTVEQTFLL